MKIQIIFNIILNYANVLDVNVDFVNAHMNKNVILYIHYYNLFNFKREPWHETKF